MKKLFVVALLLVGTTTFAQERMGENNDKLTPEQRVNLQVKKLTKELNLSDKQAQELKEIVVKEIEQREGRKAEIQARKAEKKKMASDEMNARKMKFEEKKMQTEERMKKILTPEQFLKWTEIRKVRKEKMADRIENRM
jgi:Spy/CpxP family protein refolding chaperone